MIDRDRAISLKPDAVFADQVTGRAENGFQLGNRIVEYDILHNGIHSKKAKIVTGRLLLGILTAHPRARPGIGRAYADIVLEARLHALPAHDLFHFQIKRAAGSCPIKRISNEHFFISS